jgi:hypothetical protein
MLINNGVNPATNATVIPPDVLEMATSGITVWPFTEEYAPLLNISSATQLSFSYPEFSPSTYGGGQYRSNYRGHDLIEVC